MLPLSTSPHPYRPSGFYVLRAHDYYEIQDLVLVDERETAVVDALVQGGLDDCVAPACRRAAACAGVEGLAGVDAGEYEERARACMACIRAHRV